MMKFANVIYNYSPKNDDELELKEGDEIEVLGFEEEGWWKGKLKGRIGVFPSNFVQVIEINSSPASSKITTSNQANNLTSKLNLFGKSSKTSLSSNSLNSINSNSNNNSHNNNNYHNSIMNNTQQQQSNESVVSSSGGEDPSASERRPKPIRGIGYGDIFAAGAKPKPPLNTDLAGNPIVDRLASNLTNSLTKQPPKKPPPPAPSNLNDDNANNSTDQAPALPPKPGNQFSTHLHHSKPYSTTGSTSVAAQPRTEQAKVIYAYEPSNDDELALEVGDVITIIDKEIEDQGWWKGELRGKIGVFPDNFVQLIEVPEPNLGLSTIATNSASALNSQDWCPKSSNQSTNSSIDGKIKSVFENTPKGFSRELENNLGKHNGPASFLSLKRNKIPLMATSESMPEENGNKSDENLSGLSNTPKLNHITASRAKGPARRPPSNILNKRGQSDHEKLESNGKDDPSLASLPVSSAMPSVTNHDTMSSLPLGQHSNNNNNFNSTPTTASNITGTISTKPPWTSLVNATQSSDTDNHVIAPKTSQRVTQPTLQDKEKPPTTPSWMLELKKAHAEKRRDNPTTPSQVPTNDTITNETKTVDPQVAPMPSNVQTIATETPITERKLSTSSVARPPFELSTPTSTGAVKSLSSRYSTEFTPVSHNENPRTNNVVPIDNLRMTNSVTSDISLVHNSATNQDLAKQVTATLQEEISGLRTDIKNLREEFQSFQELKTTIDVMKGELKTCQIATESQKKWIKDLVDNLADERKKIAAMQTDIDRNIR